MAWFQTFADGELSAVSTRRNDKARNVRNVTEVTQII